MIRPTEAAASLPEPDRPRSPWQKTYEAAHRLRRWWYRDRAERLPVPVVSIGNLHWGGSGKTPLVKAVAVHLRDRGLKVAILSRGYGRKGKDVRVVSVGDGPLLGPQLAGDEPVLLAGDLPGVAVVVGAERSAAGRHALQRLDPSPEIFLLDDGFSHLALARDLDLLAFPASDPFGGGRLAPSGRLREPLTSSARAHAAILTGRAPTPDDGDDAGEQLAAALAPFGFSGPGFSAPTVAEAPRLVTGAPLAPQTRVLIVTAIARPRNVQRTAEDLDVEVTGALSFADHHRYPEASLRQIEQAYQECSAEAVLTTSKDRVKLLGRLDLPLAEIPIHCQPESAFWTWFDDRIDRLLDEEATSPRSTEATP